MKCLITNTDTPLEGINTYLIEELKKTNLNEDDIVIEDALKVKIGMMELFRIFDENGMASFLQVGHACIHLLHTGNTIEFSDAEIQRRFEEAYECILTGVKEKLED